jgi:hypothetical protein
MVNEDVLKTVLITLANACKLSAQENSALAVEVASLQHAADGLVPKFAQTFQKMKKENLSLAAQKSADVIDMIDEIIRRLKDGEVC